MNMIRRKLDKTAWLESAAAVQALRNPGSKFRSWIILNTGNKIGWPGGRLNFYFSPPVRTLYKILLWESYCPSLFYLSFCRPHHWQQPPPVDQKMGDGILCLKCLNGFVLIRAIVFCMFLNIDGTDPWCKEGKGIVGKVGTKSGKIIKVDWVSGSECTTGFGIINATCKWPTSAMWL